jgi:hypothetical protein
VNGILISVLSRLFGVLNNGLPHLGWRSDDLLVELPSTALHGFLGGSSCGRRKLVKALIEPVSLSMPTTGLQERQIKTTLERARGMVDRIAKVKDRGNSGGCNERWDWFHVVEYVDKTIILSKHSEKSLRVCQNKVGSDAKAQERNRGSAKEIGGQKKSGVKSNI